MPQTALLINGRKVVIITELQEGKEMILVYNADDNYKPLPDDQTQVFEMPAEEEEKFHRNLRKDAIVHGHLVKQYCTNPEWNSPEESKTEKT